MRNWTAAGLGAIATLALIGGTEVIAASDGQGRSGRSMHQMRMHDGHGGMFGAFCRPQMARRMNDRITAFESFARFEGEQQEAWTALRDTLTGAQPRIEEICGDLRDLRTGNSVEKLTTVEEALGQAAAIAADLRPAYARFYGTLDETQQDVLDDLFTMRGHARHDRDRAKGDD